MTITLDGSSLTIEKLVAIALEILIYPKGSHEKNSCFTIENVCTQDEWAS